MRPAMTADDFRRNAAEEGDPLLLGAQDLIHYAELLIRFHDHRVLSPGYQFWGNLADLLNMAMHIPDRTQHSPRDWRVFNTFQAMAVGYIQESPASDEYKRDLLRRYFPPEPDDANDHDQETTR